MTDPDRPEPWARRVRPEVAAALVALTVAALVALVVFAGSHFHASLSIGWN